MTTTQSAPHRVMLHVGAPKSGTTFLQRALWNHRHPLREVGVTCPGTSGRDMFLAAIEVREAFETWGQDPKALAGTWARLCEEARAFSGTTVMSHELLGAARPEQARRALDELAGLDVHLVYTARDLARQLLSEWQERVKNGSTQNFDSFQRTVMRRMREDEPGLFWRNHGLLDALHRWAPDLPPSKVHVVVAPPPGADPLELWRRFGDAVGFDAAANDPTEGEPAEQAANKTLGMVQVAALRRLNRALDGRIRQPAYGRVVKRQVAQGLLAKQTSERPACPPALVEELRGVAVATNSGIVESGYRVHGDLSELLPQDPPAGAPAPDELQADDEADALASVLADVLVERAARAPKRPVPEPAPRTGHGVPRTLWSLARRAGAVALRRGPRR